MYLEEDSIDDLLNSVYSRLFDDGEIVRASKGTTVERVGAILRLKNPRARLSTSEMRMKLFSALGEFLWYLAGSDDPAFIGYYIRWYREMKLDGDGRVPGAYGPRMFGTTPHDQFSKVVDLLRQRPTSRRAVIQLYRAEDLALSVNTSSASELLEVPCTCSLQFLIRADVLHMIAHMRSNDAYKGLPHDVFCFTMIQELVARAVGVEVGSYVHSVGSLHLYDSDWDAARKYLTEGWHNAAPMQPMPAGDQKEYIALLLEAERHIRTADQGAPQLELLPQYWKDIGLLLETHKQLEVASPAQHAEILRSVRDRVCCEAYKRYLLDRQHGALDAGGIESTRT